MTIDWKKIARLIPVIAGVANPALGAAAALIESEAEKVISEGESNGQTRDEIIAAAQAQWDKNVADADALLHKGHNTP
jgi:hypothetical protein